MVGMRAIGKSTSFYTARPQFSQVQTQIAVTQQKELSLDGRSILPTFVKEAV
jgi:hypothetical protein